MVLTAGLDVGSTYTKCIILDEDDKIIGRGMDKTGYKILEAGQRMYDMALENAGLKKEEVSYLVATGYGRHRIDFRDAHVTDLTAAAAGTTFFFPETTTVLDIGGQTMKASKLDDSNKVKSFRLNDKCAAGTGAFLEKTAHYMGYNTTQIGGLLGTALNQVPISGVCAVFAESEVINQLSLGSSPADIMMGAIESLVDRSMQLMKRIRMEPEYTLVGGILRWKEMVDVIRERVDGAVNVPMGDLPQFTTALGAARLARRRYARIQKA